MKKKAVIGIGNPLRSDDGLGIVLIEKLRQQKETLPSGLDLIDGGTGGMNLVHILEKYDEVLVVDAVDFGVNPGDIKVFNILGVKSDKVPVVFSTHEDDLLKIVKLSKEFKKCPDKIIIFGIQPKNISFGQKMTEEINNSVDFIFKELEKEIFSLFC